MRCEMSNAAYAAAGGQSLGEVSEPIAAPERIVQTPVEAPISIRTGEKIGPVRVVVCRDKHVELRTPSELSWGGATIGLVPIVWCLAAWTICLHEHVLRERLGGCVALTAIAMVSAVLMNSCLGVIWRF